MTSNAIGGLRGWSHSWVNRQRRAHAASQSHSEVTNLD